MPSMPKESKEDEIDNAEDKMLPGMSGDANLLTGSLNFSDVAATALGTESIFQGPEANRFPRQLLRHGPSEVCEKSD